MQLYFFGAGKIGQEAFSKCMTDYQGNQVLFLDNNKTGKVGNIPIVSLESVSFRENIIITVGSSYRVKEIYLQLEMAGYENLYFYRRRTTQGQNDDFLSGECQKIDHWGKDILPQVEMHAADWCNLNCRGCTHFSPIFEKKFPDIEERMKDVQVLKEKFSHIIRFYLLGGEPFLNPEIGGYIQRIKKILPSTDLWIVTNGLLLPNLKDDILGIIKENDVSVSISEYEPTHNIMASIIARLEEYKINYDIRPYDIKQKFNLPLSISVHSRHKQMCMSKRCINIYNGKIARCPTLMYIDEFNKKFGTSLPNEGIISLEDDIRGEELLQKLNEEVPLCNHCVENEIEWEQCGGMKNVLSDFAVMD